jgi:small-conductance mechanosensitive channel
MVSSPFLPQFDMTWLIRERPEPDASQAEISTSWALLILIVLLIVALFASYILQTRKIQAVHETVMSIFAGTWISYCVAGVGRSSQDNHVARTMEGGRRAGEKR